MVFFSTRQLLTIFPLFFNCHFKELWWLTNILQLFSLCSLDLFNSSLVKQLSGQISEIKKRLSIHGDYLALFLFIIEFLMMKHLYMVT